MARPPGARQRHPHLDRQDDALAVLLQPEQIRHNALSRQLVLNWVKNRRGHRDPAVDDLAGRLRLV